MPTARALPAAVALCWAVALGASAADDPPRFDKERVERETRAILEGHGVTIRAGLWVGEASGDALYASGQGDTLPTASAIKTAILIELFARFADALDRPPAGLDAILRDDHPAIAHFAPGGRDEVRGGLAGASVRRIGGVMMGSIDATNLVYNAAANVAIGLLGGPAEATRSIGSRDPAFAPIAVRRYMLADRKAHGDNEATTAALASVLQRLASRRVPGLAEATVEDIRRAVLAKDDPRRGRVFSKEGDLATSPITCVRSGWAEGPGRRPVVFVVMVAQDGPGGLSADAAHAKLAATAARLADALLDGAIEPPR
jgi:hypothetical protein